MEVDHTTDSSFAGFIPGNKQEDDSNLIVEFFVDKKLLGKKSEEAGRQVYEDREYVRIRVKGQKHQVVVNEVDEKMKQRFPIAYHRFMLNKPAPVIGTPIEQLPGVGPSLVDSLKVLGLRTIEDVGRINDDQVVQAIGMGARDLIKRAKAFVAQTSGENVELRNALEAESAKRRELEERLAALEKAPPRQRRKRRARRAKPEAPQDAPQ